MILCHRFITAQENSRSTFIGCRGASWSVAVSGLAVYLKRENNVIDRDIRGELVVSFFFSHLITVIAASALCCLEETHKTNEKVHDKRHQ